MEILSITKRKPIGPASSSLKLTRFFSISKAKPFSSQRKNNACHQYNMLAPKQKHADTCTHINTCTHIHINTYTQAHVHAYTHNCVKSVDEITAPKDDKIKVDFCYGTETIKVSYQQEVTVSV